MLRCLAVLLLACAGAHAAPPAPMTLAFDPRNADIRFKPRIAGFLHPSGAFLSFQGKLALDPTDLTRTRVRVSLSATDISVPLPGGAARLRSADYFDAARHPEIDFRSTSVSAQPDGKLSMSGLLTLRGVTRPETLDVSVVPAAAGGPAGFRADGVIRRSDFGMTADPLLVGDEIRLRIDVTLAPQEPPARQAPPRPGARKHC